VDVNARLLEYRLDQHLAGPGGTLPPINPEAILEKLADPVGEVADGK
jgi:hypothetical protein